MFRWVSTELLKGAFDALRTKHCTSSNCDCAFHRWIFVYLKIKYGVDYSTPYFFFVLYQTAVNQIIHGHIAIKTS